MKMGKKMIASTDELLVGDWIYMLEGANIIHKTYVTEIKDKRTMSIFCIGYYIGKKFVSTNKEYKKVITNSYVYSLVKAEDMSFEDVEDKRHLIDVALITKDENWFRELVD